MLLTNRASIAAATNHQTVNKVNKPNGLFVATFALAKEQSLVLAGRKNYGRLLMENC